jgi:hypothetical protein
MSPARHRVSAIQPLPSLREQVGTWLRGALFTGDLVPGSTFSYNTVFISDMMKCSRIEFMLVLTF